MPNHFHAVIIIQGAGAYKAEYHSDNGISNNEEVKDLSPKICSLSDIIRDFKSYTSHLYYQEKKFPLWHRGYYERIIRDDADFMNVRRYIADNIIDWRKDEYYHFDTQ
jgi:putative transposase